MKRQKQYREQIAQLKGAGFTGGNANDWASYRAARDRAIDTLARIICDDIVGRDTDGELSCAPDQYITAVATDVLLDELYNRITQLSGVKPYIKRRGK